MDMRLIWLAVAAFVGATEGGLIGGVLPSISEDMGVSIGQAGQVMIGYAIAYAIGTPLLAVVLGGIGRRRVLAWSEFGLAVCCLLIALSPFFGWMVGVRTILAVCAGTFTGTAVATAAMIAAPGQRGKAIQIVTMGQSLAAVVGVPLGAYVAAHYDWRINYAAIALMALAASLALYTRLPRGLTGDGDTQTMGARIRVLLNPGVRPALLVTFLFISSSFPIMIFIGPVVTELGISRDLLPVVLLASGVGAVLTSLSAGRIADRLGNRTTVVAAILILGGSLAAFALLPLLPVGLRLPGLMLIFAIQTYMGFGYWIAHCSQMAHMAPSSVPVAISLDMSALNLGMAAAAAFGGPIVDRWGALTLPLVGIPIAVAALVLWLSIRQAHERETTPQAQ